MGFEKTELRASILTKHTSRLCMKPFQGCFEETYLTDAILLDLRYGYLLLAHCVCVCVSKKVYYTKYFFFKVCASFVGNSFAAKMCFDGLTIFNQAAF